MEWLKLLKGFCLPVQVETVSPPTIAALVLLTLAGVTVTCLVLVPNLWTVTLSLAQLLVVSPMLKDCIDYRKFVLLHIGTDGQAMLSTLDGRRLKVGLGAMLDFGSWTLITVRIHKRRVPLVIGRLGNEEHFHRLRLLARGS